MLISIPLKREPNPMITDLKPRYKNTQTSPYHGGVILLFKLYQGIPNGLVSLESMIESAVDSKVSLSAQRINKVI